MNFNEFIEIKNYELSYESISEPRTNESKLSLDFYGSKNATDLLIYPHSDVNLFKIDFPTYIAYSVTSDEFTSLGEEESFEGDVFRVYEKSNFLDFYNQTSAIGRHPKIKLLKHYSFLCIEHKVDVLSFSEPLITKSFLPKKSI